MSIRPACDQSMCCNPSPVELPGELAKRMRRAPEPLDPQFHARSGVSSGLSRMGRFASIDCWEWDAGRDV